MNRLHTSLLVVLVLLSVKTQAQAGQWKGLEPLIEAAGAGLSLTVNGVASHNQGVDLSFLMDKPSASATVQKAYLLTFMGDCCGNTPYVGNGANNIPPGVVLKAPNNQALTIANTDWNVTTGGSTQLATGLLDVTDWAAAQLNSLPAGDFTMRTVEQPGPTEGNALYILWQDPTDTTVRSFYVLWGWMDPAGDSFTINLPSDFDRSAATGQLDMGIGIGHAALGTHSQVDVNGQRVTSAAGGSNENDSGNQNQCCRALFTIGGKGDSNANPANPMDSSTAAKLADDELYNLLPFIAQDTTITVSTNNPSLDDVVYTAYFSIKGAAGFGGNPPPVIGSNINCDTCTDTASIPTDASASASASNPTGNQVKLCLTNSN